MFAAVDWSSVHVAGAFILGAVFATIATIRVTKAVVTMLSRADRDARTSPDDDSSP